jgi:hypothetical protein
LLAAGRAAFELESVIGDVGNAKGAIAGRGEKFRDPRFNGARRFAHDNTYSQFQAKCYHRQTCEKCYTDFTAAAPVFAVAIPKAKPSLKRWHPLA